jgi:hypothetical protein
MQNKFDFYRERKSELGKLLMDLVDIRNKMLSNRWSIFCGDIQRVDKLFDDIVKEIYEIDYSGVIL